ncbi:MAG: hypothetical protein HGA33_06560 [Candidatus Moranbacteria bacterium]|nr:hypothetical protein [Candidatus Moranbacteria bacterium]
MKRSPSANYTISDLDGIIRRLIEQAGDDGPGMFLRGELEAVRSGRSWQEKNGIIRFGLVSDNTSGLEWNDRLESQGIRVSGWARGALRSNNFIPTCGVYEVVVFREVWWRYPRTIEKIIRTAQKKGFVRLTLETACLMRERFLNEELRKMGFRQIIFMHDPIDDDTLLSPFRLCMPCDESGRYLNVVRDNDTLVDRVGSGFAFVARSANLFRSSN